LAGVVLAAWLAGESVRQGRANMIVYAVGGEMSAWRAGGLEPGEPTRAWARAALEDALRLEPRDPTSHELLGILDLRSVDHVDFQRSAVARLLQALHLRPTSPYTWASLARALYEAGDTGPSFELALRRAAELGPSEPDVQRTVVDYGLALDSELSLSTRSAVDAMLAAGVVRNPLEMLRIGDRRGRLTTVCRDLIRSARPTDPESTKICQRTEATP
jgi:hypothetical protein